jgi:Ca2+-binding EF-hand superfamily protein
MHTFSRLTAPAMLLAGLGAAGAAWADFPMGGGRAGIEFEAIDADTDGSLSRAELTARATERLGEPDANGDGVLDRAELVAGMPGPRGGFLEVFAVDPAEARADRLLAFMGATEAGRIEVVALAERHVNGLLARLDADRDGAVSREEAEAAAERRAERRHHRGDRHGMAGHGMEGHGMDRDQF